MVVGDISHISSNGPACTIEEVDTSLKQTLAAAPVKKARTRRTKSSLPQLDDTAESASPSKVRKRKASKQSTDGKQEVMTRIRTKAHV